MTTHGDERGVFHPNMVQCLVPLGHIGVVGPVKELAVVLVGVELFVFLLGEEGLVGIEGLNGQKPVVLAMILFQKPEAVGEGPGLGHFRITGHILAIDEILFHKRGGKLPPYQRGIVQHRQIGTPNLALPGVALLAPRELIAGIAVVIGGAAVLPVVVVVGAEMRIDPVLFQQLRHGVVKGLQRAPAPMEKVIAPGVQLPAGGHAGMEPT